MNFIKKKKKFKISGKELIIFDKKRRILPKKKNFLGKREKKWGGDAMGFR